jgi:primosomal protein N' (replication factor Y) (superfamily II helicase)
MSIYQILIPPLEQPLSYEITAELAEDPIIGQRVLVPLKRKWVTGYLWERGAESDSKGPLKAVSRILDPLPLFSESMRPFFLWIARYYLHPLGQVLKAAVPAGLSVTSEEVARITDEGLRVLQESRAVDLESGLLATLSTKGHPLTRFGTEERKIIDRLEARGWVERDNRLKREKALPKKQKWVYPGPQFRPDLFLKKDLAVFEGLAAEPCLPLKIFSSRFSLSSCRVSTFVRKGLLEIREQIEWRNPFGETLEQSSGPFILTGEQQKALDRISRDIGSRQYRSMLLHGVTGSGKTEVYLQAAAETLAQGRQALILVPEIGLVHQMEARFRHRFADRVALLHSGLNPGERLDQWRKIQSGLSPIVIGTRSAIFAPLTDPGLIVVDEEHDPSYKQMDSLRYNARDLALVRGQMSRAVVVLGSATPAIGTLFLRRQKKIDYLRLSKRVNRQVLPEIHLVDLKKMPKGRQVAWLSPPLEEAIHRTISEGRQTLLFLNRRGFDTLMLCTLCGAVLKCRNCALTLTHHAREGHLLCHTCGYRIPVPSLCPECGQKGIKPLGLGTEKVEQELARLFPGAAIDRMDRDTVTRKQAHLEILKKVRDRKTDILIGTQMITKGHDFPQVTLIGVLCADLSLNWPDFRAGERTFQLLAQVAGRAGRGSHPGQVFIQTFNPDHYIFRYVYHHDYLGFYRQEIGFRRDLRYPPFSRLVNVLFQGNSEESVKQVALQVARLLKDDSDKNSWSSSLEVLGPVPAPITRIKGRFRWQMLLKGDKANLLHQAAGLIRQAHKNLFKGTGVQIVLDVDPVDML